MAHRFFVDPTLLHGATSGATVTLQGDIAQQIGRVLRLRAGDTLILLDGTGDEFAAEVTALRVAGKSSEVDVVIRARANAHGEPAFALHLYQALLKGDHFTYALQKAIEVGVTTLTPLISERCIVALDARDMAETSPKMTRWREIVREAAEQSRRARLPHLTAPRTLSEALREYGEQSHLSLIAWEGGVNHEAGPEVYPLRQVLAGVKDVPGDIDLFIGPEGGFTAAEVRNAVEAGCIAVGLGPRILRAETAGPVAAALVLYDLGQMD